MAANRTFQVSVIGLSEKELRVLKSVATLSTTRVRAYEFHEGRAPMGDIYLVDGQDTAALETWNKLRTRHPAPAIVVTADGNSMYGQHPVKRPIIVSRLLAMLDEIVTHDLHYHPELNIGEDTATGWQGASDSTEAAHKKRFLALVVDDSPTVRKQVELSLKPFGCAVDCVETGEEALQSLAMHSYDIVFLDVVLPGADGYQVCKTIKRNKSSKNLPVIMLTGKTSAFDQVRGSLAGCDSYLTKPVENTVFKEVVMKYLGEPSQRTLKRPEPAALAAGAKP